MTPNSPAAVQLEHAEFVRRIAIQLAGADEGQDVAQEAWAKVLARPGRGARFAAQRRCRRQPMRMRTPFDVAMPNAFSVGSIHTDCE